MQSWFPPNIFQIKWNKQQISLTPKGQESVRSELDEALSHTTTEPEGPSRLPGLTVYLTHEPPPPHPYQVSSSLWVGELVHIRGSPFGMSWSESIACWADTCFRWLLVTGVHSLLSGHPEIWSAVHMVRGSVLLLVIPHPYVINVMHFLSTHHNLNTYFNLKTEQSYPWNHRFDMLVLCFF